MIINTADENALIGLEPIDDAIINGAGDEAMVARIHNNLDSEITLETTVDTGDAIRITETGNFGNELSAGDNTELSLECESGGLGSGEAVIAITVEKAEAQSLGIRIEQASMTVTVEYDCGGRSDGNLKVRGVSIGENNGFVVFDVENVGNEDAKIQRASIDSTSSNANKVNNGNNPEVRINEESIVDERGGGNGGAMIIDGTSYRDGSHATIGAGNTVTVRIGEFLDSSDNRVDMHGETVEFTFYGNGGKPQYSLKGTAPVRVSNSGDISTDGDVIVENDGNVDGDIDAGGSVSTNDRTTITGNINSKENVQTGNDGTINGNVDADGDISTGHRNTINGSLTAAGTITIGHDTTVDGSINAGGDIVLNDRANVDGDVYADEDITIQSGVEIDGTVNAGGTITDYRDS
ncbi:bactofilin family protein [Natronoglomus mannanivorans]|uniref:Polymer-forming cytoskeletal protein n=1 Tax=Natronoglomus mannanivorans TaxID=2979990 RepID=A0AAP3E3X5_9EURY|nr:polymer-forming cytoskeletal protein [Halobacteria archaeon AArc-xg1-1]